MGSAGLPKIFVNSPAETPDAEKWNNNYFFLNFSHQTIVRNGSMEFWTGVVPNNWTLVGAAATSAQEAANRKHGAYSVLVTYGTEPAALRQAAAEYKFYQGRKVKAWAWVKCATASAARIKIADGVGGTASAYHTGDGTWQILAVEHDMAVAATECTLELRVEGTASAYFDAAVMVDFEEARGYLSHPVDDAMTWAAVMPVGTILPFAGAVEPAGYALCDGGVDNVSVHPALYAVIGTRWGVGDGGAGSFNRPDLRGVGLRGVNKMSDTEGNAVDSLAEPTPDKDNRVARHGGLTGNVVGSYQQDEQKSHSHTQQVPASSMQTPGAVGGAASFAATTVNTGSTGGNETRAKNAAVLFIIKL